MSDYLARRIRSSMLLILPAILLVSAGSAVPAGEVVYTDPMIGRIEHYLVGNGLANHQRSQAISMACPAADDSWIAAINASVS